MKIKNIFEMADPRTKRTEICHSGVVIICILATFDLLLFNVILRPLGTLECLTMVCNSKKTGRRAKQSETCHSRVVLICL